jgi:uncharacterized membrane protein (UPF0127 family)
MRDQLRLVERSSGRPVVDCLEIADGFWSRLVGLQLRSEPPPGFGLLLVPCSSIHTGFMRFPIDVLALNRDGRVVDVRHGVRPWRLVVPQRPTFAILEVASGVGAGHVEVGATLRLHVPAEDRRRISRKLTAWCESMTLAGGDRQG